MKGNVIVISGVSGAGKSTLGELLRNELSARNRKVKLEDGDSLRTFFDGALQYSENDRLMVSKILIYGATLLSEYGVDVILSTMLSQPSAREFLQSRIPYTEIFLDAKMEKVISNDAKSIYATSFEHKTSNIVGVDLAFNAPLAPDLTIATHSESPDESFQRILQFLDEKKCLGRSGS